MMPTNRGVGSSPVAGSGAVERGPRAERREGFGECLRQLKKTGGEATGVAGLVPFLPVTVASPPPEHSTRPLSEQAHESDGSGAAALAQLSVPTNEARSQAVPESSTERGHGAMSAPTSRAVELAPSEKPRDASTGSASLPDAVLERLAAAVREAARERRAVTVLELEPPGGGTVEIRLDTAAARPSLRLVCHGWNGYLPLARDLPALQTRLGHAGVMLQDISLVFERRVADTAESTAENADPEPCPGDDESDADAPGLRPWARRKR